ncbi:MAG: glutamate--cysteine ligase, partial [Planctomycetota bacterium]
GYHPLARVDEMPWMPKKRYVIMKSYLPQKGRLALDMMLLTASLQASFDYSSEEDMAEKFRLSQGLDPLLIALYAHSPFRQGRYSGFHSFRGRVWEEVDPHRCCYIPQGFHEDFSFDQYIEFLLDVPMLFLVRNGKWYEVGGITFREFWENGFHGHCATMGDWLLHTTGLFTQVRLRPWIEVRSPDLPPHELIMSFPALMKGILYDKKSRQECWNRIGSPTFHQAKVLRHEATLNSLQGQYKDERFQTVAMDVIEIARAGLASQNDAESLSYLDPLENMVKKGKSPAAQLLEQCSTSTGELLFNCECVRKMILSKKK